MSIPAMDYTAGSLWPRPNEVSYGYQHQCVLEDPDWELVDYDSIKDRCLDARVSYAKDEEGISVLQNACYHHQTFGESDESQAAMSNKIAIFNMARQLSDLKIRISELETQQSLCVCCVKNIAFHESAIKDNVSIVSDSSSNAPEDISEYFRLAREVYLLEEKLRELSFEQPDVHPDSPRDSDVSLEPERMHLSRALETVQQDLQAQRTACLGRGLDPERYRHRRISSQSTRSRDVMEWLARGQDVDE